MALPRRALLCRALRGRLLRPEHSFVRAARSFSSSAEAKEKEAFRENQAFWEDRLEKEGLRLKKKLGYRVPDVPHEKHEKDPCFAIPNSGGLRQYVFNREHVGHSLNLSVIKWLTTRVWMYRREKDISCLLLRGKEPADDDTEFTFSVGTDHPLLLTLQENERDTAKYYTALYQLCYLIFRLHKPFLAYMNGRVGGNAAALGVNATFRIATEDSCFYLPQTGHGFIPEAGLTYFLSRLDGGLGMFLALTGQPLYGADLVHAGIATHYQMAEDFDQLIVDLEHNSGYHGTVHERVEQNDAEWQEEPFSLAPHMDAIHRCFTYKEDQSVQDIIANLEKEKTPWAEEMVEVLLKKSPICLEVAHRALCVAKNKDLESVLKLEFKVANKLRKHPDYAEGVSATLHAAKRTPSWSPPTLQSIKKSHVSDFFSEKMDGSLMLPLPIVDMRDPYITDWKTDPRPRQKPLPEVADYREKPAHLQL